ncbi:MAG: hypothetical protein KGM47_14475 [Acidobacteriota bacterium]|nr:hypothetical protein [Acidobacteriota bacterium]
MYYALFYDTVPDYLERRTPFRQAHLAHAERAHKEGKLILAGAYAHPADGALFVFRAGDSAEVSEFARNDPYVVNGIVSSWRVREWTVVIGGEQ